MQLSFGKPVRCADGGFGELADVVVDPDTMRLTHLITDPPANAEPRLIPIELADTGAEGPDVTLRCTVAATEELASVREYRDLRVAGDPTSDAEWDVGVEEVLTMPSPTGGLGLGEYDGLEASLNISYDRVPKGSAELRRASSIVTTDGDYLGGVNGLQVDGTGQITNLVLDEGHFWSRREITIPVDAVQSLETDMVTVRLSQAEVGALPSVRVRRWF
jgi:sporulation protein YlmC with PRC-barrel domain